MRSNSGRGKSNNNLRDPTMKEHEDRRKDRTEIDRGDMEHAGDIPRRSER